MAIPYEGTLPAGGIEVAGARNDDGVLALTVRTDDVSPAEVFAAVLRHSNDEIARLVAAMDAEVPPATSATLTGGWAAMASVRRARAAILPDVVRLRPGGRRPRSARPAWPRACCRPDTHPVRRNHEPAHHARTPRHDRDLHRGLPDADRRRRPAQQHEGRDDRRRRARSATPSWRRPSPTWSAYLANSAPAILLDPEIALPAVVDDGTLAPRHRAGRRHGRVRLRDRRRPALHPVRAGRHRAPGPRAGRRRREDALLRPPGPPGRGLPGRRRRSASWCATAPTRGSCSSSSCSPTGSTASPTRPTARRSPASSPTGPRLAVACGAKTLKLQYPGSAEGCAAVTAAAAGVPWAVLSAGVDHATFLEQVRTAMANGASGAMAGRSLWKDSLSISAGDPGGLPHHARAAAAARARRRGRRAAELT